jgi:mono/diheme cytochrome c family protein
LLLLLACGDSLGADTNSVQTNAVPSLTPGTNELIPALPPFPPRVRRARTNYAIGNTTNNPFFPRTAAVPPTNFNYPGKPFVPIPPDPIVPDALKWDSRVKDYAAKSGQAVQDFTFAITNVWTNEVTIRAAHTSCGCTVAHLPSTPWILKVGEGGEIKGTVNLAGKFGSISKTVTLDTSVGAQAATIKVEIPMPDPATMQESARSRNLQVASADRQAVFRGECASCHVSPTVGKHGKDLFAAACGVCHDTPHRASMVPDLHALKVVTSHDYWMQWISNGKTNSLMPAFALKQGGILTDDQIQSLAEYLTSTDFVVHSPFPPAADH